MPNKPAWYIAIDKARAKTKRLVKGVDWTHWAWKWKRSGDIRVADLHDTKPNTPTSHGDWVRVLIVEVKPRK